MGSILIILAMLTLALWVVGVDSHPLHWHIGQNMRSRRVHFNLLYSSLSSCLEMIQSLRINESSTKLTKAQEWICYQHSSIQRMENQHRLTQTMHPGLQSTGKFASPHPECMFQHGLSRTWLDFLSPQVSPVCVMTGSPAHLRLNRWV